MTTDCDLASYRTTESPGIATLNHAADTIDSLLRRADPALRNTGQPVCDAASSTSAISSLGGSAPLNQNPWPRLINGITLGILPFF